MNNLQLTPSKFYSRTQDAPIISPNKTSASYQLFAKQDEAFHYFDQLPPEERAKCKIFTYESRVQGKRKFLVSQSDVFLKYYASLRTSERHYYEIIRENFPCRAYFDLEFTFPPNADINVLKELGEFLVSKWISLVLWKLYELFGLQLGGEHVVLLDSTSETKFSKHIIIIIKVNTGTEILFKNNGVIAMVIDTILRDMTIEERDSNNRVIRKPKIEFEDFWVFNGETKAFLVDLGVYSRNRAFRLWGSCKFGKKVSFSCIRRDSMDYSGVRQTWNNAASICQNALIGSAVVPFSVLYDYSYESKPQEAGAPLLYEFDTSSLLDLGISRTAQTSSRDYGILNEHGYLGVVVNGGPVYRPSMYQLSNTSSINVISDNWRTKVILESKGYYSPSLFPRLDDWISSYITRDGSHGRIGGWTLYVGSIQTMTTLRIRYHILHYRFCANIGRPHKSNGIMLEVDITLGLMYQTCWDPNCRGFRSDTTEIDLTYLQCIDIEKFQSSCEACVAAKGVDFLALLPRGVQ